MRPLIRRRAFGALTALVLAGMMLTGCVSSAIPRPTVVPSAPGQTVVPSPPSATSAPTAAPTVVPTAPPAGEVMTVRGDEQVFLTEPAHSAVHCDGGGEVRVQFAGAVTITGTCDDVAVTTSGATVTLERADDVDVEGSGNQLTATAIDDLEIRGNDNRVTTGSVREVDIEGSRNAVVYGSGTPEVDAKGTENTVTPQ